MSEIINAIMQQISWRELDFCGFIFVKIDNNTLRVNKGSKNMDISYNEGLDLYSIKKHTLNKKDYSTKTEELNHIYFDQLKELIEGFFNFEYVMCSIVKVV